MAPIVNAHRRGQSSDLTRPAVNVHSRERCPAVSARGPVRGRRRLRHADGARRRGPRRRRRELGTAVHAYRHGVIDQRLPVSGEALPPDWALQDPDGLRRVDRRRRPRRGRRRRRRRRRRSSASAPTSPRARWCRRSPTARRCAQLAEFKDRPARLREAVEAPRRPAPGRSHQRSSPPAAASRGWRATAG